ncbi:helix-turn-helix transcriptional regulator [Corynebacterium sp. 320]|uniref:Helix-turn-helix transcriptional regulator n=1 Tax=Corynebacterium zhongnanshanii TaxID=2768834 RepID=A0ABQ6VD72_9CORY|nr:MULTISPECIES: helix-turn-helix transcriptional regulator [Corynebacterium]KAB1502557.1 helix-turn-helix transcriptional regulator [Corynebacterium sp. 320]KAB1551221.1 helix-turn-helix transcriptional regulator [Corynebacterium sp. 321]KAB1551950.1 helix-turn-helix transcriptional regulator [Corynebacterium sp. 319]KAB3520761.1 helix-turn-helix transcriptional regulator [Corynebacterium zhongnanshanii]KAB3526164.1 helix-turn-helix transcriptional regulator [Corynebacterium sp. 250]
MKASEIGIFAREQRRKLQLTQRDLADLADVSERFIRELENGKHTTQLDKTIAVLSVLGFDLEPVPHNQVYVDHFQLATQGHNS